MEIFSGNLLTELGNRNTGYILLVYDSDQRFSLPNMIIYSKNFKDLLVKEVVCRLKVPLIRIFTL